MLKFKEGGIDGACGIHDINSWSGNLKGRDCLETYRVSFLSCSGNVARLLHSRLVLAVTSSDMIKEETCRQ